MVVSNTTPIFPVAETSIEIIAMDTSAHLEAHLQPPPISVYEMSNYPEFSQFLSDNEVVDYIRKEKNSGLILMTKTGDQF